MNYAIARALFPPSHSPAPPRLLLLNGSMDPQSHLPSGSPTNSPVAIQHDLTQLPKLFLRPCSTGEFENDNARPRKAPAFPLRKVCAAGWVRRMTSAAIGLGRMEPPLIGRYLCGSHASGREKVASPPLPERVKHHHFLAA